MGDLITNFLSGGQSKAYGDIADSYGKAQDTMSAAGNKATQGLEPFTKAGQDAIPGYQDWLNKMQGQTNGNWMDNYKESPYAKYLVGQETTAANNAAAGGGILGTVPNMQDVAKITNDVTSGDMQNYFHNMQDQNQMIGSGYSTLMGNGLNSATASGGMQTDIAKAISGLITGQGMAKGNEDISSMSGITSFLKSILGSSFPGGVSSGTGGSSGSANTSDSSGKMSMISQLLKSGG